MMSMLEGTGLLEAWLNEGWSWDFDGAVFYCPNDGNGIEPDGVCYCGTESPLRASGLI